MSTTVTKQRDDIEYLNNIVLKKTAEALNSRKKDKKVSLSPEMQYSADHGEQPVYHHRYEIFVWIMGMLAVHWIYNAPSRLFNLVFLTFFYFYGDIYSGILHIVLDHPAFLNVPLINVPCLEFQWHHNIPYDITSKSYFQVCGDLNAAAAAHFVWWHVWYGGDISSSVLAMGGMKLLYGYLGQWAHRAAHENSKKRDKLSTFLQDWGFIIHPDVHRLHHQTHDQSFPILNGWTTKVLGKIVSAVPSRSFWLGVFIFISFSDVIIVNSLYEAALKNPQFQEFYTSYIGS